MSGEWYDDRRNLAAVARYMNEQGDSAAEVAYMLEKPWKFEEDWRLSKLEGVGTGAGEGATGQDTGNAWVTRSEDCPEAPAQAHPLALDPATRADWRHDARPSNYDGGRTAILARRIIKLLDALDAAEERVARLAEIDAPVRVGFRYRDGEVLSPEREASSEDEELPVAVIDRGDGEWLTLAELRDMTHGAA